MIRASKKLKVSLSKPFQRNSAATCECTMVGLYTFFVLYYIEAKKLKFCIFNIPCTKRNMDQNWSSKYWLSAGHSPPLQSPMSITNASRQRLEDSQKGLAVFDAGWKNCTVSPSILIIVVDCQTALGYKTWTLLLNLLGIMQNGTHGEQDSQQWLVDWQKRRTEATAAFGIGQAIRNTAVYDALLQ